MLRATGWISHLIAVSRCGQLRFRAETYGLYYPCLPDERRWWSVSPRFLRQLSRQVRSYASWQRRMERLNRGGAHEWWGIQYPAIDLEGELKYQLKEDDPTSPTSSSVARPLPAGLDGEAQT